MKNKVSILLSTYNGERFLHELLDSLLSQSYNNFEILIRDDGSTDNTKCILNEYSAKHTNIFVHYGPNIGVLKSFFNLLELAGDDCEYIAFCDQDDVWKDFKIDRAVSMINDYSERESVMYCSNYALCDDKLNILKACSLGDTIKPSFSNALIENIAAGCTTVINNSARSLILRQLPKADILHDWWFYLVVSAFGKVIYDKAPTLCYRQHESNVVGAKASLFAKWKRRLNRYLINGEEGAATRQAQVFRRLYGAMVRNENMGILNDFIDRQNNIYHRFKYAITGQARRQSSIETIIFKVLYLFKRA